MEITYYGIRFVHDKGEFCSRRIEESDYLFSYFRTDYLYEKDGKMIGGNAGDILIMTPGTLTYHGPQSKETIFVNDWIKIAGAEIAFLLEKYPLPLNEAFSIQNQNLLCSCIEEIMDELLLKQNGYEDKIACIVTKMIIDLSRLYERAHHSLQQSRLETARGIFLRHPEKNWTLKEMAELCGYSASRFSALYVAQFGCSPKADLLCGRIELAKHMLHYGSMSVTEVSEKCGFHSVYYFSKYFKEAVGVSPKAYAGRQNKADKFISDSDILSHE